MNIIYLDWPIGQDRGKEQVDLDQLTPMARAMAEAIARRTTARIRIKSRRMMRDLYQPGDAEFITGPGSPKLDQPMTDSYDRWAHRPPVGGPSIHEMLEYESRKFPGWYPIADDGSDLPSSRDAGEDDGITSDQVIQLLYQLGAGVSQDMWMRKASKGIHGFPAPARHNGYRPLWSEKDVREFADRMSRTVDARLARQAAALAAIKATERLRAEALSWLDDGATEMDVAAWCGVTITTVRDWQGKSRRRNPRS